MPVPPRRLFFCLAIGTLSLKPFAAAGASILINEVAFDASTGSPDWVELFNAGAAPISVDGWTLDDQDAAAGKEITLHLSTPMPAGAFLTVYVDEAGADETDFSDGAATVYSGTATTVSLAVTEDEVALYRSTVQISSNLADFFCWVTDGDYDGGTNGDQTDAVNAGLWPLGEAFALDDAGSGYSVGRRRDGADSNRALDWAVFAHPSPGASNLPPAQTFKVLAVDPARNPFSPFDPDPLRRSARIFFNVGSGAVVKTIRVFDVTGRLVRVLVDNDQVPGGSDLIGVPASAVLWDGKDESGRFVPVGPYGVFLEGADGGGGTNLRGKGMVVIGRPM